ncbi:MAG: thiolase family protein [Rhodovulum sp.]|nr:thiolase family protein [Rhodovulum sp.]
MPDVYLLGSACTPFGRLPHKTYKDLTRDIVVDVLADARLDDGEPIGSVWFGNCGMGAFEQRNIRGQVCFTPLVRDGRFPERVPIVNVEGGCATASLAFYGAVKDVASGETDVALAIGVEKTFFEDRARTQEIFDGAIDRFDPHEWEAYYTAIGERAGKPFTPKAGGATVFMSTYAMQAAYHMKRFGTTQRQIAAGAAKNHHMGSLNPGAQYRFEMSVDEVLNDREVSWPLTRAMCAPIGDGAAGAVLCSEAFLASRPPEVRERAVRVLTVQMSGGKYRDPDEPGLSRVAARKAYDRAGLSPADVDIAEVHDATAFCELYQCEMLGFCPDGEGGAYVESGATSLGGERPVNLSGGLVSKGHPIGATGLSMIHELVVQLRGEAGPRQAERARVALAENGGGVIGFDEAICAVTLLAAPRR